MPPRTEALSPGLALGPLQMAELGSPGEDGVEQRPRQCLLEKQRKWGTVSGHRDQGAVIATLTPGLTRSPKVAPRLGCPGLAFR